jgi:hypothetical protein
MRNTVRNLGGGARRGISVVAPGEGLRRHAPTEAHAVAGTPMEEKSSGDGGEGEDGEGLQIHLSWYVAPPRL